MTNEEFSTAKSSRAQAATSPASYTASQLPKVPLILAATQAALNYH